MKYKINWVLSVEANDKKRALECVNAIQAQFPYEIKNPMVVKHLEMPTLQVVKFSSPVDGEMKEEILYNTLVLAKIIAKSWLIDGPHEKEDGEIEFNGSYKKDDKYGYVLRNAEFQLVHDK